MEVPNPPKNMSKEEWAVRCIEDQDFFEKALIQKKPLRKYWIKEIQVWMTGRERSKFRRRKNTSAEAWGNYIWDTQARVYREGFIEKGLRPLRFFSFKFEDDKVTIEEDEK